MDDFVKLFVAQFSRRTFEGISEKNLKESLDSFSWLQHFVKHRRKLSKRILLEFSQELLMKSMEDFQLESIENFWSIL